MTAPFAASNGVAARNLFLSHSTTLKYICTVFSTDHLRALHMYNIHSALKHSSNSKAVDMLHFTEIQDDANGEFTLSDCNLNDCLMKIVKIGAYSKI